MTANEAAERLREGMEALYDDIRSPDSSDVKRFYNNLDAALAHERNAPLTVDDIRAAIDDACPLINPRLSEVDWADVARRLTDR